MEPTTKVKLVDTVTLSEYEAKLFGELLDIVNTKKLGTTLRVAGGWVRDKVFPRLLLPISSWATKAATST
ncbi:MAG: hypothetical protein P4M11_15930 [Candidatus Pacebacteria bacterium]|nr:hypothetical protein [Candidatus Paceibacterota bacterium]